MSNLVGKTISKIWLADDREAIKFTLVDGQEVVACCDGDCCSHTWIEDLVNPEFAIGTPVLTEGDLNLPIHLKMPTKTGNHEEEMQYYGFFVETALGRFVLAYRNSSNGYYGGSLVWPGEDYYGGVREQNKSSEKWILVCE